MELELLQRQVADALDQLLFGCSRERVGSVGESLGQRSILSQVNLR